MAVDAMKAGAFDFVQKPYKEQELLDRVQKAVNRSVTSAEQNSEEHRIREQVARRTPRERQVFEMIATGEPNKRIAHHLDVSEKTVEFHSSNLMKKLESHSIAELTKKALISAST